MVKLYVFRIENPYITGCWDSEIPTTVRKFLYPAGRGTVEKIEFETKSTELRIHFKIEENNSLKIPLSEIESISPLVT